MRKRVMNKRRRVFSTLSRVVRLWSVGVVNNPIFVRPSARKHAAIAFRFKRATCTGCQMTLDDREDGGQTYTTIILPELFKRAHCVFNPVINF